MNILRHPSTFIFFIGFIVYLSIRGYYARRSKQTVKVHRQIDGLEVFLLLLVIPSSALLPLLYLFTPWLSLADYRSPTFVPWLGVALIPPALWLFWRSHADLGRNWSVSLEICNEHQLVMDGVYRFVRHPMYAALFLWSVAQALVLPNWLAGCLSLGDLQPDVSTPHAARGTHDVSILWPTIPRLHEQDWPVNSALLVPLPA
jgi:protein-S-isoprenylcysteine O-methyltransferase Ste14